MSNQIDGLKGEFTFPDKGSGRPGSMRWHLCCIKECESIAQLREYLISVTGKDFSLEMLKNIAYEEIKEFKDGEGK